MSESAEHSASTLPPLPTTSSECKNRSTVWDHFKRTSDDENKAQCQHCLKVIKCRNGTSAMRSHLKICKSNPGSDKEIQSFKEYSAALQPGFNTLSRITLAGDILMLYETKKDGLKEIDDLVTEIRDAVKYVRSSNSRLTRFKACIAQENIPHKSLVCIDVEPRWNSTYLMLVAALKHQKAFELLEMQDKKFVEELNKGRGVPSIQDWDYAKSVLPFLEMFYDATLRISGSSYVTSNLYMKEVFALGRRIQQYNKYWGNAKTINMLLLIAVVLDPCHKLDYVKWCLVNSFGVEVGGELKTKLSSCLYSLYNLYQGADEGNQDDTLSQPSASDKAKDIYDTGLYRRSICHKSNLNSELDRYLNEDCEPDDKPLDILGWWKVNSNLFSVLANMARDILAIPVSTVASESAFSMGERIIDQYRSSLTPKMVEALVCTEDWLKGDFFSSLAPENFEEFEKVEQEDFTCSVGLSSIAIEDD
ncbi:zinc finger BED domain-containing protein RICESLEEPER 2-like [Arachis hypogaea]|uniref:zinc finger BED domain-containing protein RICESLEEPER 2-like n=1 Tax=Arachis hypogaea TaxID=3818 RepID=UPI000DED2E0E|nr:zinc finger BED domain-containing protein RICESLEEPER 2-like [Arachis hypogaea]